MNVRHGERLRAEAPDLEREAPDCELTYRSIAEISEASSRIAAAMEYRVERLGSLPIYIPICSRGHGQYVCSIAAISRIM